MQNRKHCDRGNFHHRTTQHWQFIWNPYLVECCRLENRKVWFHVVQVFLDWTENLSGFKMSHSWQCLCTPGRCTTFPRHKEGNVPSEPWVPGRDHRLYREQRLLERITRGTSHMHKLHPKSHRHVLLHGKPAFVWQETQWRMQGMSSAHFNNLICPFLQFSVKISQIGRTGVPGQFFSFKVWAVWPKFCVRPSGKSGRNKRWEKWRTTTQNKTHCRDKKIYHKKGKLNCCSFFSIRIDKL